MVIVTYDEFGGEWDHVSPPGQGNSNGPHDEWGPGTRIPALVLSPHLKGPFVVDSTEYDTTSILATIEQKFALAPLGPDTRDGKVASISNVFDAHGRRPGSGSRRGSRSPVTRRGRRAARRAAGPGRASFRPSTPFAP